MKKHLFFLALVLAAMLLASACGKESDAPPSADFSGQTLSISVCFDHYNMETAIARFKEKYPEVEVVLNKYNNDITKYSQQISTQLMSGTAGDIVDAVALPSASLADSGLLADIYPLMNNDPAFNEDDYYMNVFAGMAYKSKLIVFPTNFTYSIIGANNKFSPQLTDSFEQYEKISYRELFNLHNSLGDTAQHYLAKNIDAITAIVWNASEFIDFENKVCYFNTPEFIQFIIDAKNGTNPQKIADGQLGWTSSWLLTRTDQEEYARQHLFAIANCNDYWVYVPYVEPAVFTHFIPMTNADGELLLTPSKHFCVSEASANKELAWEFLKFLTTPEANENAYIPRFPVHKGLFKSRIAADIEQFTEAFRTENALEGETADIVAQVMAKLEAYNEMPMQVAGFSSDQIYDMFAEVITNFYNGTLTAEQAASELQNKVSLYLME